MSLTDTFGAADVTQQPNPAASPAAPAPVMLPSDVQALIDQGIAAAQTKLATVTPPPLPPFAESVVTLLARHGLTAVAGILATKGFVLSTSEGDKISSLVISGVVLAAGVAWSYFQKLQAQTALKAALVAPPVTLTS